MKFDRGGILSLGLIVLFFSYTFNGILIYADYYINQDFIANVLCINKTKPQMHCSGHCYLEKQLEKENQTQAPVTTSKQANEVQLFSEGISGYTFFNDGLHFSVERTYFYLFPVTDKHLDSIFRPPCV